MIVSISHEILDVRCNPGNGVQDQVQSNLLVWVFLSAYLACLYSCRTILVTMEEYAEVCTSYRISNAFGAKFEIRIDPLCVMSSYEEKDDVSVFLTSLCR